MTNLIRLPLLAAALAVAGCGDPTGTVAGRVTVDGQKLTAGSVTFMVAGVSYSSDITPDGGYSVGPLPTGEATVLVFDPPNAVAAVQLDKEQLEKLRLSKQPPPQPKAKPPVVPANYSDAGRSPLKTTVRSGAGTFDIALKK